MDKTGGPGYKAVIVKDDSYYPEIAHYNVPLLRGTEVIERPADQNKRSPVAIYDEAIDFIRANKERPFFLYLPHNLPHIPLFASPDFRGKLPEVCTAMLLKKSTSKWDALSIHCENQTRQKPWSFSLPITDRGSLSKPMAVQLVRCEQAKALPRRWSTSAHDFLVPDHVNPGVKTSVGLKHSTSWRPSQPGPHLGPFRSKARQLRSLSTLLNDESSPRSEFFYWTNAELHGSSLGPRKLHIKTRELVNYSKQVYQLNQSSITSNMISRRNII